MNKNQTRPTDVKPEEFLARVEPEHRREEGERMLVFMREATGDPGTMWGPSIVGFGTRHYTYKSGREGDWPKVGFSPRKARFTFYGLQDLPEQRAMLVRLGEHSTGAGCVYVKNVDDLDAEILKSLIDLGMGWGDFDATA